MRLRDVLYSYDFTEPYRGDISFSDATKVRLDPADNSLKLKSDSDGDYPTDDNLWVKTQLFWPRAGKGWSGFTASSITPAGTSLGYRLNDDADDFWWDGAAWSTPGASDWNTEAEVASNIASYTAKKLRVVINLATSDADYTPIVDSLYVGYKARIVFLDQWIYRTLVPTLRNGVRPIAAWPVPIGVDTDEIDLNDYRLDTPFDITGIDAVFNHSDDPDHDADLFQSYDPGTKIITLSSSIEAGKVAWIDFFYEPEVAALTSVDYHELRKVPALTIENLTVDLAVRSGLTNVLVNKGDHTKALKYEAPWQCCLKGDIVVSAPRGTDEMALVEEVIAFISENQTITVPGTDEQVDWIVTSYYTRDTLTDLSDLKTATIAFELRWLRAWLQPVRDSSSGVYSVTGMRLTGSVDVIIQ